MPARSLPSGTGSNRKLPRERPRYKKTFSVYLGLSLGIAVLQLSGTSALYAQQKLGSKTVVNAPDDRSPVRVRYPDAERLRDLQTDRDYQYGTDAPPPDNPVMRFLAYVWRKIMEFLASESYQNFWQYVFLAGIAAFVIYLLLKAEVLGFLFPKRAQSVALAYENVAENIHEIDFNAAVDEAVSRRNYRLAVRLRYLQTLKYLTDAGLIQYKPDKTNRQYVYELAGSPRQDEFERLTRQFEFVWYGDFPVDEARFAAIQAQFRTFQELPKLKTVN